MLRPLVPLLALLALVGCNSDDDDGPSDDGIDEGSGTGTASSAIDAGDATLLGLVSVDSISDPDEPEGTDSVSASFLRFPSSDQLATILSRIRPETGTCNLTGFDDDVEDAPDPTLVGVDESVDAGEVIVFTSPMGTWLELTRRDVGDGLEYLGRGEQLGPAPAGLVVDIPGADFPAFAAVPVPAVTPLVGLVSNPTQGPSVTDTFRWDAADDPASVVTFSFSADNLANDTTTNGFCIAVDDGEFSFPAEVIEMVGTDTDVNLSVTVRRESLNVERQGDALLLTFQGSEG